MSDIYKYYTQKQLDERKQFELEAFSDMSQYDVGVKSEEISTSHKVVAEPPRGKINKVQYVAPDYDRDKFIYAMNEYSRTNKYENYKPLTSNRIFFRDTDEHLNFFHPDMIKVMNMFLRGYQMDKIEVVKGMSSPHTTNLNAHSIGMAIDIKASDKIQRNHIMNCAWEVGIPNIVQAGDGSADMHIHLDICPKAKFMYDGIYYEGPWSLSRFT